VELLKYGSEMALAMTKGKLLRVNMTFELNSSCSAYLIGKIESNVSDIKTHLLEDGSIVFAFVAPVSVDGDLLNAETLPKPGSTGREWETLRNRFWNTYTPTYSTTLWYTSIVKDPHSNRYRFCSSPPIDALYDTAYIFPWQVGQSSEPTDYDLSSTGIVLTIVNDIDYNFSTEWVHDTLFVPIKDFTEPAPHKPISFMSLSISLGRGGSARFSPDGKKIVLLKQRDKDFGVYTHKRVFIVDVDDPKDIAELPILNDTNEDWDIDPHGVEWSADGQELYFVGEYRALIVLFAVTVPDLIKSQERSTYPAVTVRCLTKSGCISSFHPFQGPKPGLFVNSTSLVDSSQYALIYPQNKGHSVILSSATNFGSLFGISASQVSEFLYKGAGDYNIQCLVMKPSNFDKTKKYPCLLWVHGGPQSAWYDSWSSRWCTALFAEQGYIIIMPNITGSTGFGEEFSGDIIGDWAKRPTSDLDNCWSYVEKNLNYVDTDRAVIMGGSYGGYMMYWIAGQPLAKKFKAMVCHQGVFCISNLYAGDIASTVPSDIAGVPWENQEANDAQDPSRFTANWTQPMLIIHSELDYRCEYSV
jgi:dipeptidyl aminopeptidase/acylaminoacyl peptidase